MKNPKKIFTHLPKSSYFPIFLGCLVILLSFFHISGSSVGIYDIVFGKTDSSFISGDPRTIRSDEWIVTSPFIFSQEKNNFPIKNSVIGQGQNMSLVVDVPYLDWSTVFKPQNLVFLFTHSQFAFAFKWWFLAAILGLSVYYFILYFYPKRLFVATLLAIFTVFNPFIQWWYQSITILAIAYGLILFILFMKVICSVGLKAKIFYSIPLWYTLICFVLLMYPAFQISVALAVLAILIPTLIYKKRYSFLLEKSNLIILTIVSILSIAVVGLFIIQNLDAIKATLNTIYPGKRDISSGGLDPWLILSWPLNYLLTSKEAGVIFSQNQSESSNFILAGLATIPFLIWQVFKSRNNLNKLEKGIIFSSILFLILLSIRAFTPLASPIFKLFGLSSVPHNRLMITFAIINLIIIAIITLRKSENFRPTSKKELYEPKLLAFVAFYFVAYSLLIYSLVYHYSLLSLVSLKELVFVSLIFTISTAFLTSKFLLTRYVGLSILVIFTVWTGLAINPLYRGNAVTDNPLVKYIDKAEDNDTKYWVSNNSPVLSSLILSSGAEILGGVNTYPQNNLWGKYFPTQSDIYNRYAHIRFDFDEKVQKPNLKLIQEDSYAIRLNPCDPLIKELGIGYIVSEVPIDNNCLLIKEVNSYYNKVIYIYKI